MSGCTKFDPLVKPASGMLGPVSRRSLFGGTALLSLTIMGGCGGASQSSDIMAVTDRLIFIQMLSDITIPATDTLGAGTMETAKWVDQALANGMREGSLNTLTDLKLALSKTADGADFMSADKDQKIIMLTALDDQLSPKKSDPPAPWSIVKSLILRAYYTSEAGASEELIYELVPGRFDPAVPITKTSRAYSTDQNARNLA